MVRAHARALTLAWTLWLSTNCGPWESVLLVPTEADCQRVRETILRDSTVGDAPGAYTWRFWCAVERPPRPPEAECAYGRRLDGILAG